MTELSAQFIQADALYDAADYDHAFKLFKELAEQGDVNAMTRLALMYELAQGTAYSFEGCLHWEKKAADLGDATALFNLGVTYRRAGDVRAARACFEPLLEKGDGEAAFELAKMYLISEKETTRVKEYLSLALQDEHLLEFSREEIRQLLKEIDESA